MKLAVILEPSEEAGFTVLVPALPGCISEGDTREEALKNIREAIELYLEPVEDDLALQSEAERGTCGMTKVPSLDYEQVVRALQRDGWVVVMQRGSHIRL